MTRTAASIDHTLIPEIRSFLLCETPDIWVTTALENLELILVDHATNEMKAAQSAMTLMSKHPHKVDLLNKMSRLAREELIHFEQVLKILKKRGIKYQALKLSTYAATLATSIRKGQDEKFLDTLIVSAIIEARSCERFEKLAPFLDADLSKFYLSLLKSEARHYQDYLTLAERYAVEPMQPRVDFFLERERQAISEPDPLFRFHSGLPVYKGHKLSL